MMNIINATGASTNSTINTTSTINATGVSTITTSSTLIPNTTTFAELTAILNRSPAAVKAARLEAEIRQEEVYEAELRRIMGDSYGAPIEKKRRHPGAIQLREKATMIAEIAICKKGVCQVFSNGYAIFDNGQRKTVLWVLDCKTSTYYFTCTTTGLHSVLVISNNENNYRNEIITVIPITSNTSRLYLPTQVGIRECELARVKESTDVVSTGTVGSELMDVNEPADANKPVDTINAITAAHSRVQNDKSSFKDGALLLDQVTTIDKALLRDYVGRVRSDKLADIELALRRHLGMSG